MLFLEKKQHPLQILGLNGWLVWPHRRRPEMQKEI